MTDDIAACAALARLCDIQARCDLLAKLRARVPQSLELDRNHQEGTTAMADNVEYKIKKGDTLPKIAKEFGVKKWETIWDARENKTLVTKRKKPEAIQPGDVITISADGKLGGSATEKLENLKLILTSQTASLAKQIDVLDEIIASQKKINASVAKMFDDDIKDYKDSMKTIDDIAELATTLVKAVGKTAKVLGDLGQAAEKGAQLGRKKLKDLFMDVNKEAVKIAKEDRNDKIKDKALNLVKDQKDSTDSAIAFLGKAAEYSDKLVKPSFLSGVYVQMRSGKDFKKAMATDLLDDMQDTAKETNAQGEKLLQGFQEHQTDFKGQLSEAKKILQLIS